MDIEVQDNLFQQRRIEIKDKLLTYSGVKQKYDKVRAKDDHSSRTDNPHKTSKHSIKLGNVNNYRLATPEDVIVPSNILYSTPLSTQAQIDQQLLKVPSINYTLKKNRQDTNNITISNDTNLARDILVTGDTTINFTKTTSVANYKLKVLLLDGNLTLQGTPVFTQGDFTQGNGLYYVDVIFTDTLLVTVHYLGRLIDDPTEFTYIQGDSRLGYVEEVTTPPFNVSEALSLMVTNPSQHINTDTSWFKVVDWGNIYYIAKEPMLIDVTYEQFSSKLNKVFDNDYVIDALYGDVDTVTYPFTGEGHVDTVGSQYNNIIQALTDGRWESLDPSEMGIKQVNGLTWCKSNLKEGRLVRGSDRASMDISYASLNFTRATASIRPVIRVKQKVTLEVE